VHVGIDSFVSAVMDPETGHEVGPVERIEHLLEEIALADSCGLYSFGIGEHHREEFYDSAPPVLLAAAAARTSRIRLGSAVTVLSAADPVRVFQQFATLDLIAKGRVDLIVGRGSFTEAFPLFGLDLADYDSLFDEKLDLLLRIRDSTNVTWSGRHRPPLSGQGVYPRPAQDPLPIWIGVGGTPESFVRAGVLGLPLMVAIIGGEPRRFAPLVDLYRRAGLQAGPGRERLRVGLHVFGYVGESGQGVYPRPAQDPLPIWIGVGGTPESFVRAGVLGLPLMVAIIGGEPRRFAPLVDLYRRAGLQAGHGPEKLRVGLHVFGYVGESVQAAGDIVYPGWHQMFTTASRERGFPPPTRAQFDATSGADGAFFMGDPETIATKLRRVSEQLGGVERISIQMTNSRLSHANLLRGIELLGTEVAPAVADV